MRHARARRSRLMGLTLSVSGGLLLTVLIFLGSTISASSGESGQAQTTPTSSHYVYLPQVLKSYFVPPTPNYRFGYGMAINPITDYDPVQLSRLRAGVYVNWTVNQNPARPNNMEYIQMVRLHQNKQWAAWDAPYVEPYTYTVCPSWTTIASAAVANPGSIWLIGNEIERVDWPGGRQDEILPELYAQAYHEIYTFVKQQDPTALIAIGGVIQATPLRLKYLDRVWDEYQRRYGHKMPVDIWNVHGFVLREKRYYPGCPDCWGADVPVGLTETVGILSGMRDADNLEMFKQRLVVFRQWLRDKDERDKVLLVTEYGPLIPYGYVDEDGRVFSPERARDFLYGTFDFMQNAIDPDLGCPADKNRLVQQWFWFSLDAEPEKWGSNLFDYQTKDIAPLGLYWQAYVNDPVRMPEPRANLFPLRISAEPSAPLSTAPVTLTLQAEIANSGSLPVTQEFTVRFYDAYGTPIGDAIVPQIRCCGWRTKAEVVWTDVPPGAHQVRVCVDLGNLVAENDEEDNCLVGTILVASHQLYLPLARRN